MDYSLCDRDWCPSGRQICYLERLHQCREIDDGFHLLQGVANGFHLADVPRFSQKIVLHRRPSRNHLIFQSSQQVRLRVEGGRVIVEPIVSADLRLDEHLRLFDPARHGGEVMADARIGAEQS